MESGTQASYHHCLIIYVVIVYSTMTGGVPSVCCVSMSEPCKQAGVGIKGTYVRTLTDITAAGPSGGGCAATKMRVYYLH